MRHQILGEIAQYARLELEAGDTAWASRGSLMAYSSGIEWEVRIPGGLAGAARRSLAGEGLSLAFLEARVAGQFALLSANAPGHLIEWDLAEGAVIATRGAFLAAWGTDIEIDLAVAQRAGAAFFGGAGVFLQRIAGSGTALVHARGDFRELRLAPGEQILVSTGNVAAFAAGVDYDIQGVGGVRKALFGREGLFMTRLTGPGRVLLQSLKRGQGRGMPPGG